jgi:hypothetical protein
MNIFKAIEVIDRIKTHPALQDNQTQDELSDIVVLLENIINITNKMGANQ